MALRGGPCQQPDVTFGGTGTNRTVRVTPVSNASGTATIVLRLSDGALTTTTSFSLTVTAVDDPPSIGVIPDQQTPEDTPTAAIPFTIGDVDNPASSAALGLSLSGASSNTMLVPNGAIVFGGSGANRTVTLTPEPGQTGATKRLLAKPRGWCYAEHGEHKAYGSMTVGGIGAMCIIDYMRGKDWKRNQNMLDGLQWISQNFTVTCNPGPL